MLKPYQEKDYRSQDYDFAEIEDDPRFVQAYREGKLALAIWVAFTVVTLGVAYVLGMGDPTRYSYVCGLPLWLFGVVLCVIACLGTVAFVTKKVFTDIAMGDEEARQANSPDRG